MITLLQTSGGTRHFDLIVIGAGPAGAMAADEACKAGLATCLIEKKECIGIPVRCGELIRLSSLEAFGLNEGDWITKIIDSYEIISLQGSRLRVNHPGIGALLDRRIFDDHLVNVALSHGCVLSTSTFVNSISTKENRWVIDAVRGGKKNCITSDFLLACDGVGSRMASFCGLNSRLPVRGLGVTVSCTVASSDDFSDCAIILSGELAPGGYGWIFRKTNTLLNVGIGVNASNCSKTNALQYLDNFLKIVLPGLKADNITFGGVPIYRPRKLFSRGPFGIAGDAARLSNPITGAGIYSAMLSGHNAGRFVKFGEKGLRQYSEFINDTMMNFHVQSMNARDKLSRMSDQAISERIQYLAAENFKPKSIAHSIMSISN